MEAVELGTSRGDGDGVRRYRPVQMSFDFRANLLRDEPDDSWEAPVIEQHEANRAGIRESLLHQFGVADYRQKELNFLAVGVAPVSVLSIHNMLVAEVRDAFVSGYYYPALVGAVALGERVLNDLIIELRDDFAEVALTKRVQKASIANWNLGINALLEWAVVDPPTAAHFRKLARLRNDAVHFNLRNLHETGARREALEAIELLQEIISYLFTAMGGPPRFIADTPGEFFISRSAEAEPLVRRFYVPNCVLVSREHRYVDFAQPSMHILDNVDFSTDHGIYDMDDSAYAMWSSRQ